MSGALACALAGAAGCTGPLHERNDDDLRASILRAVDRELAQARDAQAQPTTLSAKVEPIGLSRAVLEQIDFSSGPDSYQNVSVKLAPSLLGADQPLVPVSLLRAVMTTADNNLSLQFSRLIPSIGEARLVATEAAFDWTLFGASSLNNVDRQLQRTSNFTQQFDQRLEGTGTLGLRRRLATGGQVTLQGELRRTDDDSPGITPNPNPGNAATVTLQLDQALMRGFGPDATLAEVRLAANARADGALQVKGALIQQVTDAETAYWDLYRAYNELKISRRLLERSEQVRDTLRKRQETARDVRASQFSDAVANAESRRGDVIRAEAQVRAASDQLKAAMNDPNATVGSELLLLPQDTPVTEPFTFTLLDIVTTALSQRPEVQRALLAISDGAIRQQLADNARLPQLDMRLQLQMSSLRDDVDVAVQRLSDANFVSYLAGLSFEQPIGNRAGEAGYRARQLETMQARIVYREVVQRVLLDVKSNLRNVATSFALIEQTRAARVAAAENLRTLEVEERTIQNLTPEFLDLKLRRQQGLAQAEFQELAALVEYNNALARLHGAMGTALSRNRIEFAVPTEP